MTRLRRFCGGCGGSCKPLKSAVRRLSAAVCGGYQEVIEITVCGGSAAVRGANPPVPPCAHARARKAPRSAPSMSNKSRLTR